MFNLADFKQIYFFRPYVDFRKGRQSLAAIIQDEMELNPFEKYLFLFCSQDRKGVKMLYWDRTGFALWYKRLESDRYRWPRHLNDEVFSVDPNAVIHFLSGLNPWDEGHKELHYSQV